ncbi:MAG: hypothetical protein RJB26_2395 [Pseudomonadota bacterium]
MTLWITAILLWAFTASFGTQQGAIRMLVSLVGVVVATAVSFKFDHLLRPFVPLVGISHPAWYWFLPPLLIFTGLAAVFWLIAQAVHHHMEMRFKYKTRDGNDLAWERLNSRLGTCVGVVAGTVYLFVLCQMAGLAGYFMAQFKSEEEPPLVLRVMNSLGEDVNKSGLNRLISAMDPTPTAVYDAADVLGLLQHNPDLLPRVADYPFFLGLGERPEFQDIATDANLQKILRQPEQMSALLNDAKVQAVIKSEEIRKHLHRLEPKDLLVFLQTGASSKYTNEIYGRWELDAAATTAQLHRVVPGISASDLRRLESVLETKFRGTTLVATIEEKVFIKSQMADMPNFAQILAPSRRVIVNPTPQPQQQPRRRPGGKQPGAPPPPPPTEVAAPEEPARTETQQTTYQGSWKQDGDKYTLNLQGPAGEKTAAASVTGEGKLHVKVDNQNFLFGKP